MGEAARRNTGEVTGGRANLTQGKGSWRLRGSVILFAAIGVTQRVVPFDPELLLSEAGS